MSEDQGRNMGLPDFRFSVDSQLIGELGERLVTNNYIAVSELIKNAYDADSPTVSLNLINITQENESKLSKIVIKDTGVGMTLSDIKNYWMKIATPHKAEKPTSALHGRPRTGNKGIGRFACQRISRILVLESCAKVISSAKGSHYENTRVTFNWDEFKPGMNVDEIPCRYETNTSNEGETGITLNLIDLREKWTRRDFLMLQKSVALVSVAGHVKRKGFMEDPGFEASVVCEDFEDEKFDIGQKILASGWGTLRGKVRRNGEVDLTLTSASDDSPQKYKLSGFDGLDDVNFEIHIMPAASRIKSVENRRSPSKLTKAILDQIWENHSGVRLYLNKFRVYPYGDLDSGDDWLNIGKDIARRRLQPDPMLKGIQSRFPSIDFSRSMLNHPGLRAHIGSVNIEGEALKYLQIKMDREGLLETKLFKELKRMIRVSLDWAALNYEAFLRAESKKVAARERENFIEVTKSREMTTKQQVGQALKIIDHATTAEVKSKHSESKGHNEKLAESTDKNTLAAAVKFVESTFSEVDAELDTLRSVAATAPLLFVFSHEFKGIIASLLSHAVGLENLAKKADDKEIQTGLIDMATGLRESSTQHEKITHLFDVFSDSQGFHKKKANLKRTIDQIELGFGYLFSEFDIDFDTSHLNPIYTVPHLNEAELYSVLINAVSNAVKALIAKSNSRKIYIDVVATKLVCEIRVSDTGVGLHSKNWNKVFAPFVSDPEGTIYSSLSSRIGDKQLATLGKGSGLGLHIMKSILEKHSGVVEFEKPTGEWKTTLLLRLAK